MGAAAVAILAVGGPFVYLRLVSDSPPPLSLPTSEHGDSQQADNGGVDGTWTVGEGSEAGYRIEESIMGQSGTAVGRTDDVTGTVILDGSEVTSADITVDMASVASDQHLRDEQFQTRIMDVATYPTATFSLTEPADFGSVPDDDRIVKVTATGDLSLHGTTKRVTAELSANRNGNDVQVSGTIEVSFADFDIPNPGNSMTTTADHGTVEFLLTLDHSDAEQATSPTTTPRRSVTDLSAQEKQHFIDAIVKLQHTRSPNNPDITWYEQFVQWHLDGARCENVHGTSGALHYSPLFLPWHRELLLKFETALQQVSGDPTLRVPYWDFTDPDSSAVVFSDDFMGGMGDPEQEGAVTTGPFAKGRYELRIVDPPELRSSPALSYLTRNSGAPPTIPAEQVEHALGIHGYDAAPYDATSDPDESFRNAIEGWRDVTRKPDCSDGWVSNFELFSGGPVEGHNAVHMTIGGTAMNQTSPNDPVFWLLHANVDRIWAHWEEVHPGGFPADAAGWTPESTMWPWFDQPISSFNSTTDNGYRYDT